MSSAQDEALEALVETLKDVRATRYVTAIGVVILLYDHLLTLKDEVELVWKARLTVAQVLFLILRYLPLIGVVIENIQLSGLVPLYFPDNFCKIYMDVATYFGVITMAISDFLVLLRLWVLWDRNRRLVACSLVGYIVTQLANIACCTFSVVTMTPALVYSSDLRMCIFAKDVHISSLWMPGLIFDVSIFLATVWNALQRPMSANSSMVKALYRDGFVYFLVLTSLRVANLVLALVAPVSLKFVGVFFIWCASTVTTSRFIFSIRRAAMREYDSATDSDDETTVAAQSRASVAAQSRASVGSTEVGSIRMQIVRQSVSRKWSYL
ncbi:hypothetical protein FB107DRAFT_276116 [Schizophyllum commune]